MKYLKMIGLLAAAAATLMASAGAASATILTSPAGTTYTGSIKATATNLTIEGPFVTLSCEDSSLEMKVEGHGGSKSVTGSITNLSFTGCNYLFTVENNGSVEIHSDGSLTWSGVVLAVHSSVGTCIYSTSSNKLGTITGGLSAALDIGPGYLPRTGGNFLCGGYSTLTGVYDFTSPNDMWVD